MDQIDCKNTIRIEWKFDGHRILKNILSISFIYKCKMLKHKEKYLGERQQEKLLSIHDFLKVFKGKLVRSFVQFLAGMGVRKVPDAKAVCGVQLAHEELAARLPYRAHLEY